MANVLFLSLVGPPDGVSTARLIGGLAGGLKRRGHTVTILTTSPHYNQDIGAERLQPITWGHAKLIGRSSFEGIEVIHVAMPRKGRVVVIRLAAWIWFHLASTLLALVTLPRFDVIIAPSPPLTIGVSAWVVSKLSRSRFLYNVQEVYPDIAIELGALRNRFAIRGLLGLEMFVYSKAFRVTAISSGILRVLQCKGVPTDKLAIIPNYVDPPEAFASIADNSFVREHSLTGSFVVTYAGNIGKPQGVEVVVEAARVLRNDPTIKFVVVGDGTEKPAIERLVLQSGLSNILLLPYQFYVSMPLIYAASSVCLVLQSIGTGGSTVPSKAIQVVGYGRPILAVTDTASDLADFVRMTQSGIVVMPGQADALALAVQEMRDNSASWEAKALAARPMVLEMFSKEKIVEQYHELILEAVNLDQPGTASGSPTAAP